MLNEQRVEITVAMGEAPVKIGDGEFDLSFVESKDSIDHGDCTRVAGSDIFEAGHEEAGDDTRWIRLQLDAGVGQVDLMRCQPDWAEADCCHDGPGEHGSACLFDHEAAPTAFKSWTMLVAV